MDAVTELFHAFQHSSITLPTLEVMLLLVAITICLLLRWNRAGLMIAYADAYRWGWMFFNESFSGQFQSYMMGYYIFGVSVAIFYMFGWYFSAHSRD